jgi:Flp pilus assembly protein TadG
VKAIRRALRRRDERGAAAIEFALIFPIFAMLTFGLISAAFAFVRQINITNAAREASRYGSTLPISVTGPGGTGGTTTTWLHKVDSAVTSAVGGAPFGGYTSRCVALVQSGSGSYSVNGASPVAGTACPHATAPAGMTSYVQIVITRSSDFNYIVADPTVTLTSSSSTPYEATTS